MNIDDFVTELKMRGIDYDPILKKHWIGSKLLDDDDKVISNNDMKNMCSRFFGRQYDILTESEQRKIRESIFEKLRGENDG